MSRLDNLEKREMNLPMDDELSSAQAIYQIRVDLQGARPPIWRRLLIPDNTPLPWVHEILQIAMGWWGEHLHAFTGPDGEYALHDNALPHTHDEEYATLADLFTGVGSRARYEYDFGDGWMHVMCLEKILEPEPGVFYPQCTAGRRAGPPENVGGIPGYEQFLEALADPTHPEHESYATWIGDQGFDPEDFDAAQINHDLEDFVVSIASENEARLAHPMTHFRGELLSPALLQLASSIDAEPYRDEIRNMEKLVKRSRSATKLLQILPDLFLGLMDIWTDRLLDTGVDVGQLVIDELTRALPKDEEAQTRQRAINRRLCVVLYRVEPNAADLLAEAWDTLGDEDRSRACVIFGQKGAVEHIDLVRQHFQATLNAGGRDAAMGALWALVDLSDPMATDFLADVLEMDTVMVFTEMWPMLSRAGDARAIGPLLGVVMTGPPTWAKQAGQVLECIAQRIGRTSFRRAMEALYDTDDVEAASQELELDSLLESLYGDSAFDALDYYRPYFEETSMEDLEEAMEARFGEVAGEDQEYYGPRLGDPARDDMAWDEYAEDLVDEDVMQPERKPFDPPGRNEPCWCGSGKKYKNCHWRSDQQNKTGRVQTG